MGGELLPQKLSFERMYLDADRVVKAVMIGLALASLVTWTVLLAKTLELRKARSDVRRPCACSTMRQRFRPGAPAVARG